MLFSILSAVLLILAFPNFNLNYLAFIGFLPLFFGIQNTSSKKAFLISYLCGFLFYMGVLYWLYHVTVFGLIILCLYLALYFGIFGVIFFRIMKDERQRKILLIPAIWVLLEYIQAHLFTGFGWTLLGYSQYKNLPLIQIADFSGVYGVSFVVMLVNVIIWAGLRNKSRYSLLATLYSVTLVLVVIYSYGYFRLNAKRVTTKDVTLSVVQGNIPQETKWDLSAASSILDKYSVLTRMAALDGPDLIIWPETSFPGFFVKGNVHTGIVLNLAREIKIPVLLGANTEEGLSSFNSAVLVSEEGEIIDKYDKIHLVPFGEYVPFSDMLPILHDLIFGQLGEFTPGNEFRIFRLTTYSSQLPAKFSVLICFEDIFPELARSFVKNGAEFLVVITNDAWYGKSGAAYQHAACSVFRAIENRIPVVRCANTGLSCFIDSRGRIYASVEEHNTHLFITGYKTSLLKL